jgi:hypothetical protein
MMALNDEAFSGMYHARCSIGQDADMFDAFAFADAKTMRTA